MHEIYELDLFAAESYSCSYGTLEQRDILTAEAAMKWASAAGVICALAVSCRPAPAQGVLETIRESVRSDKSDGGRGSSGSAVDLDPDSLCLFILTLPVSLPLQITEDDGSAFGFRSFPYSQDSDGYIQKRISSSAERASTLFGCRERSTAWSVRATLEDGDDFRRLNRFGGSLTVATDTRFDVTTDWKGVIERLPAGRTDGMVFSRTNLAFNFAETESVRFYAGIGLRTLGDSRRTDLGGDAIYGFDWFPGRPFVVSGSVDVGYLGRASLFEGRTTVGIMHGGVETFIGYDVLLIENSSIKA